MGFPEILEAHMSAMSPYKYLIPKGFPRAKLRPAVWKTL